MKSSLKFLSTFSLAAVAVTGCYTETEVVREPAGAPVTRTTVRETVTFDEAPAPAGRSVIVEQPAVEERVVVDRSRVGETVIVEQPPTARVETMCAPPCSSHAWVPGHWTRAGVRWV